MKLKSLFLWSLMIIGAVSCKYDDGELWDKVNDLDGRLTNIESQLTQMNTDLASVKTIAQALQNNVYVKSVSATENGYVIIFTDGTEATISNGNDGKNAPVISVGEFEGSYYWNQTIDGATDWLLDDEGNKIPVSGQDAITPLLKVSTSGYWMISYDGGINYEDVLDAGGNPVKAIGEDGVDGSDGENGDTWFTDVTTVTKEGQTYLVVTFNGMKFELQMSLSTSSLETILEVEEGLGEWDEGFLTKDGYFIYRETIEDPVSRADVETGLSCLSYLPLDGSTPINILLSSEDKLPLQIIYGDKVLYFSYLDDSAGPKVELVYDEEIKGESSDYSLDELKASVAVGIKAEILFRVLTYIKTLVGTKCADIDFITKLIEVCETTIKLEVDEDSKTKIEILGLEKEDGVFTFVTTITTEYKIVITNVYYSLVVWTGRATFKVGGTSCTLWGTVWCPSSTFNDLGTYGIVCDTDPDKLTIEDAEYKGTGYQDLLELSYGVDFRGLKPNTKYYYRAYYRFNSADHGKIKFKYGKEEDQITYDGIIKSFTTGDNILNVDVVMCMDVTGSMSGIINTVKTNALNFYDIFKKGCDENNILLESLNTQVIAFRDKNVDGSSWFSQSTVYAMPDEKEGFHSWVNALYAAGGGDTPESGLEALDAAFSKTDWGIDDGYHRQVIILWTDAPYLVGGYSDINIDNLQMKWNSMPTGRRLILFAPNGNSDFNGGDWRNLDSWKNVIHDTNITGGFEDMEYIIDAIIKEMVGRAPSASASRNVDSSVFFRPN